MLENYVWYASYGSNLSKRRFLCYIEGGKPEGSQVEETGCRDRSHPIKDKPILMPFPLYFTKNAARWGGGVAFIGTKKEDPRYVYGRMYLITREQFVDVVRQENNDPSIQIDFHSVIKNQTEIVSPGWYGRILYVGEEEGYPIFTFTAAWEIGDQDFTKPSVSYLRTLILGYKEMDEMTKEQIIDYLFTKPGIFENYSYEELSEIV